VLTEQNCRVDIPVAFFLPYAVLLAALAFWGVCLLDFARADEQSVRTFPKQVWLLLLIVGTVIGGVLWLVAGRPRSRS
jgi:Phospholipase_D-nuclease N-terminal